MRFLKTLGLTNRSILFFLPFSLPPKKAEKKVEESGVLEAVDMYFPS